MRQASYAARQCSAFAEGNAARSTEKRSRFPVCCTAAACSVMFALCKRLFSAAPCTPPAKISSKSAASSGAGYTRSSAKLSVFSKPRYFSPISKSAVQKFECRKLFAAAAQIQFVKLLFMLFGKQQQITHRANAAPAVQKVL